MIEGQTVTLLVRNPLWERRHLYSPTVNIREFNEFTGKIVKKHKAVREGQIGLTNDDGTPFKLRVIDIDRIVGMENYIQPISSKRQEWVVDGSKGNKYTVTLEGSEYGCNCTGFGFRRYCKHVDSIKKMK